MAAASAAAIGLNGNRLGFGFSPASQDLRERGQATIYRGDSLRHIGMPIGGIGCGQVYLGGDGRLWHWDIFNQLGEEDMVGIRDGLHYKEPLKPNSPFEMGFYVSVNGLTAPLNLENWPDCTFEGRYPMANVDYGVKHGVEVRLEASSPFIPLNVEDSSYPCALMSYQVTNTTEQPVLVEMVGWMDNPCGLYLRKERVLELTSHFRQTGKSAFFQHSVAEAPATGVPRPAIVFADFESDTFGEWIAEGTAFGPGPIKIAEIPSYQGDVKGRGARVVNSHHTRSGEDVAQGDAHIGKLTSPSFKVERHFISFLVGGGNHPGQTCVNLVVDGRVVRTVTGKNRNAMSPAAWDVKEFQGREATIQIVDQVTGAWGNIGVDHIVFTDQIEHPPISEERDYGTIGIGIVGDEVFGAAKCDSWPQFRRTLKGDSAYPIGGRQVIPPGQARTFDFIVAWHFPNVNREAMSNLQRSDVFKRHYATRFRDAREVFEAVSARRTSLALSTKLWTNAWYDSTLPVWFLDRTMSNTSILSTATCYRFDDGRFYGWEGNYTCAGTCTHVWQYAQAVGRLFPALEKDTRERVDYGIAFHESGLIGHRAEAGQSEATDGQCGTILRIFREHQMCSDGQWLAKMWPKVKRSIEYLISKDANRDGILEGPQFNTLDATWYGKIAWISGLYVAALRAGEAMATEVGDTEFAEVCQTIAAKGFDQIPKELFNGEYFIQVPDPEHPKAINSNDGCHIDQALGQSWAFQVGLPRILPESETKSALRSLFKHNFVADVGAYREKSPIKGGRWYALAGEAGLVMCTWPKGGGEKAPGEGNEDWAVGYFNECMTGFEHQVAAHMLWEGMVPEALAIEKAIHDRYSAQKRNPYNEIECGDHYARAMASYGVYLAACGYRYHGPKQELSFDPKIRPEDFRCAFTAAEGWGVYEQKVDGPSMRVRLSLRNGVLNLRRLGFRCPSTMTAPTVKLEKGELGFTTRMDSEGLLWMDLDRSYEFKSSEDMVLLVSS